jgi:hypothetical protein
MLIREPLFCNLIEEKTEKFLFVDAASSTWVLGSVLLQKIKGNKEKIVLEYSALDNEVH